MRRVVVELPEEELKKLGGQTMELSRDIDSLEVLHHVRHGARASAILCRIRPKAGSEVGDLKFRFKKFEVLSEEEDGVIVYLEAEPSPLSPEGPNLPNVFLHLPVEVREGNRRVTFTGEAPELKKLFRWLDRSGIKFEVISNSDARSSPDSPLNSLSKQQRHALLVAYASGYYEVPRRTDLGTLARRQKVNKSTFAEHLAKAENRLISQVVEKETKATGVTSTPS